MQNHYDNRVYDEEGNQERTGERWRDKQVRNPKDGLTGRGLSCECGGRCASPPASGTTQGYERYEIDSGRRGQAGSPNLRQHLLLKYLYPRQGPARTSRVRIEFL
jgi:hypothetical protein